MIIIIIIIIIISYCIHMIISIPWPELDIRIPHFFISLDRVFVCMCVCGCVLCVCLCIDSMA